MDSAGHVGIATAISAEILCLLRHIRVYSERERLNPKLRSFPLSDSRVGPMLNIVLSPVSDAALQSGSILPEPLC